MNPILFDPIIQSMVFDDFLKLDNVATTGQWQSTKGTGGTVVLIDSTSGRVNIPTAASQNDYQLYSTQKKVFQFAAKKPMWAECLIQCTEANTNQANLVFGVSSVLTTGFLQTASGGPPTTFDGFVFWKAGGALIWKSMASAATVQSTSGTLATNVSATDIRLGFHFDPNDGTTGIITPLVNGVPVIVNTVPYQHRIALGSLGTMYPIFGVNAGSASAETLQVDYVRFVQNR